MLPEATLQKIRALESVYPDQRSLVMAALWAVQRDKGGRLAKEDLEDIAVILALSPVEVQAAASFYTMYHVVKPVGKYHIQVCRNISCSLLGAEHLLAHLEESLGLKVGETSPDGKFSLATVECLGSCDTAPMMQINDDYYENLDAGKVNAILKGLE
jgi:NADH-quinone oxidoreductase subunit E